MKTTICMATLVLGGLILVGCDKKDETTVTTPSGTTTVTTPSAQSMSDKAKDAASNAGDAIKTDAQKVKDAASNGMDNMKSGMQSMGDKMNATTMPALGK